MVKPAGPPAPLRPTLGPLVELLQQELAALHCPSPGRPPLTPAEFARWYLAAVQSLEQRVATRDRHAPMSRSEVELMCRVPLSAATLGEAIALLASFCAALSPRAGRVAVTQRRGIAQVTLDSMRGATTSASSLVDITGLFAFLQLFQWLCGGALTLTQVRIGPVRREDVLPFLRLFGAPVLAGGRLYALEFPAADLERAVVRTRGEFAAFFELWPCGVFDRSTATLAQQAGALLGAAIARGARTPTLDAVAATLGVPASTLRRRLERDGASFRTLRDGALCEQACAWLARGDLGVAQIAERLGFSDAASFRRAFRKWTGHAPGEWRIQQLPVQRAGHGE